MTVSEKHTAAAIDLVDSEMFKGLMAVDRIGKCAEMVAESLAAAEREGMKRAAEYHEDLAAQHEAALADGDIEGNTWHLAQSVAHRRHAAAILSQEGEA